MRLFDKHIIVRLLLIAVSLLFSVFIDELSSSLASSFLLIPYILSCLFLIIVALFYKFPNAISSKSMRKNIEISPSGIQQEQNKDYKNILEEQTKVFSHILETSSEGFFEYNLAADKVFWSKTAATILETTVDALADSFATFASLITENDWNIFKSLLKKTLETKEPFELKNIKHITSNKFFHIAVHPFLNEENRLLKIVGKIALKPEENTLKNINKDPLTGLESKNVFIKSLREKFENLKRNPSSCFALIFVDIDHFGSLNDMYSRDFGNKVLCIFGNRIASFFKREDSVARVNGDIFGILFQSNTEIDETVLYKRIEKLKEKLKEQITIENRTFFIETSIAIVLNKDSKNEDDMMQNAMTVLRNLKKSDNRGKIQFFSNKLKEQTLNFYQIELDLRKAIQADEFYLVYQPVVDIFNKNKVVSFEALVRWKNPEKGIVSPVDFIPVAETTGLIVPLGNIIFRKACLQTKEWVDKGFKDLRIAVNFSAKQFLDENFLTNLESILKETGTRPENLKMEITEYTAMTDSEKVLAILKKLIAMGFEISIDDFGTGYSSLSYLKKFPTQTLKIDKSFITSIAKNESEATFCRMIISIAKNMNLDLIAEGVETQNQLEFLKREGCKLIQGYYFSKPLSPEDAYEYLLLNYQK